MIFNGSKHTKKYDWWDSPFHAENRSLVMLQLVLQFTIAIPYARLAVVRSRRQQGPAAVPIESCHLVFCILVVRLVRANNLLLIVCGRRRQRTLGDFPYARGLVAAARGQ